MTDIRHEQDDDATREVGATYRTLAQPEPSATLDAAVREAVAREVGSSRGGPAPTPLRIRPRWPRMLRGVALAATVVAAIGIGYRLETAAPQRPDVPDLASRHVEGSAEADLRRRSEAPPPVPASAPNATDAKVTAKRLPEVSSGLIGAPARAATDAPLEKPTNLVNLAQAARFAPPPPPPPPVATEAPSLANIAPTHAAPPIGFSPAPKPASAGMSSAAEASAPTAKVLAKSEPPTEDAHLFEEVRALRRDGHEDEARRRLREWRREHLGSTLPPDLAPLLEDAAR